MMKRFYRILCVVSAILAVVCIPFFSTHFGVLFFGTLAVCCGAMWLLLRVRDDKENRFSRAAGWLARLGHVVFLLWVLSLAVVEGLVFSGMYTDEQAAQADCIFVLGAGIHEDQPTRMLRCRLEVALETMEENPDAHVIVCGGQGDDEDYTEAYVMYQWLTENGADADRIVAEDESRNTVQNIENAVSICEENGWDTQNVAVVSSGFHLFRVRHIMTVCGLTPCAAAAPAGNPAVGALSCIREYFSLVKLTISGYWQ